MQVFRLMDKPDKVIAFDSLPDRLLEGFEMIPANGFPREWKTWLGKRDKKIKIAPDRDPLTGTVRTYPVIIENDFYFYVVDAMIQPMVEKWNDICDYARGHVKAGFTLKDRIEDMAMSLAANQSDPVTLEPESVIVIPLVPELVEETTTVTIQPTEGESKTKVSVVKKAPSEMKCTEPGCGTVFKDKRGMGAHIRFKHTKKEAITV